MLGVSWLSVTVTKFPWQSVRRFTLAHSCRGFSPWSFAAWIWVCSGVANHSGSTGKRQLLAHDGQKQKDYGSSAQWSPAAPTKTVKQLRTEIPLHSSSFKSHCFSFSFTAKLREGYLPPFLLLSPIHMSPINMPSGYRTAHLLQLRDLS